ncbi:hypothetical protein OE810_13265 [Rhodobacteraceae bacterium XHP0102]|nr:hypothetical protein [Rhodobacteraceae bacterium XHP0102]
MKKKAQYYRATEARVSTMFYKNIFFKKHIMALFLYLTVVTPIHADSISIGDWTYNDGFVCMIQYDGWFGKKLTLEAFHFTGLNGHKRVYHIHFTPPLGFWGQPINHGTIPVMIRSENLQRVFYFTGVSSASERERGTHRVVNSEQRQGYIYERPSDLTRQDMNDFLEIMSSGDRLEIATPHETIFEMEVDGTPEAILAFDQCRAEQEL